MENEIKIKVEKENLEYAELLMQDYAGKLSALSSILSYAYQQMIQSPDENFLAEKLYQIQKKKMKQLEIFGKLIVLLGGSPEYGTYDSKIRFRMIPYTTCGICYKKEKKEFLEKDLQQEKLIIEQFKMHQKMIHDIYIDTIFSLFIEEQENIIQTLKQCLEKNTSI